MNKFSDFYEAYHFLSEHHYFEHGKWKEPMFEEALTIAVVKVNPLTDAIGDDNNLNTKTQIWLECGPWEELPEHEWHGYVHDIDLDCGGDTFEDAIVALANLVHEKYGENPEGYGDIPEEEWKKIAAKFKSLDEDVIDVNE